MPVQYLSVKNFEQYQRYKDRLPPWIKLHYSLLEDALWMQLDEVQQGRYMKLLLVASRCDNRIMNDQTYLQNMLRLRCHVDLTPLIHAGFLVTFGATRTKVRGPKLSLSVHRETETDPTLKKESRDRVSSERNQETDYSSREVQKPSRAAAGEAVSAKTWEAYSQAYLDRYHVLPPRNMKVNSGLCQLVKDVGAEQAPIVAKFYLSHPGRFYVENLHPVNLLVRDSQKLLTEYKTGTVMTATQARQDDGRAARGQMWQRLIEKDANTKKEGP